MATLIIPHHPVELTLAVCRLWNGNPCPNTQLQAKVTLTQTPGGLRISAEMPCRGSELIPNVSPGARVANLWEYDVVEVFFAGLKHHYLEVELGTGGHWLVLEFNEIRKRCNEHERFTPDLIYKKTPRNTWISTIIIPWNFIPKPLRALNAFVIAENQFLSFSPLPGKEPDFHQPDHFPFAKFD